MSGEDSLYGPGVDDYVSLTKNCYLRFYLFIYFYFYQNVKRVFLETMFSKRVPEISRKWLNRFTWNLEGLIYTKKDSL